MDEVYRLRDAREGTMERRREPSHEVSPSCPPFSLDRRVLTLFINASGTCSSFFNHPFGCPLQSKVVVFDEGRLYLDECDFSGSSSAVLVYAELEDATVIRNAVLGELNCELIGPVFFATPLLLA